MEIRKATRKDLKGLVEIRMDYLNEDFSGMTEKQRAELLEQLPGYFDEHLENDFMAYLAIDQDEIVASVFLVIIERPANPNFLTGKTGNILNVFTKPDYRRRGLAGQLMDMAKKEAKQLNVSYLELKATQDGYPLYMKKGFCDFHSKCTEMRLNL